MSDGSTTGIPDRLAAALADRYRIERKLGEGGMATVYLAQDLKHHRQVAIKVLKPDLAAVVGEDRFLSEIRTTAKLQHPNILPLFDSGAAEGSLFYAMPFVDGETLSDRLKREVQLPVDQALDLIRKVAAALAYAHEQGVVHRDLKPANILLSSGEPLVADFGIALAVQHAGEGRLTQTGLSMGTPHYMSPEQASGDRSLDPRSDIYALGCVLYEMLSGDPPFAGSNAQAILARILTTQAERVSLHRPTVPPHVDAAISRCLEKIPADRFNSAGDFRKALDDPDFRHSTVARVETQEGPPVVVRRTKGPLVPVLASALVLALALAGWALIRPTPEAPVRWSRLDIPLEEGVGGNALAVSPDGSQVAFVGPNRQMYLRSLNSLTNTPLPGLMPARAPFFSPDGTFLGFNQGPPSDDRIAVQRLSGGPAVAVGSAAGQVEPDAAWTEDGFIYYIPDQTGFVLRTADQSQGAPEVIHEQPLVNWLSPVPGHPRKLLVTLYEETPPRLAVLDVDADEIRPVAGTETALRGILAQGFLFWATVDGSLNAAPFDPDRGALTGSTFTIAQGVHPWGFAVSESGVLVYRASAGLTTGAGALTWVDPSGTRMALSARLTEAYPHLRHVSLSPDERLVAMTVNRSGSTEVSGSARIMIYEMDQDLWYQLSFAGGDNYLARWMADDRVAYVTDGSVLMAQPFDRTGREDTLYASPGRISSFDPPRQEGLPIILAMNRPDPNGDQGLFLLDPGAEEVRPWLVTTFEELAPAISPDGRWVAYVSNETGRREIYVRSYPDGGRPYPISAEPSVAPRWSTDGTRIFYLTLGNVMVATLEFDGGVRVVAREELPFDDDRLAMGGADAAQYDVASDGRILTIGEGPGASRSEDTDGSTDPVLVTDIFQELKARLAAERQ